MRIVTLVENTACANIASAHGLSIYIETDKHRILFDAGPDGKLLLDNAEKLGIDLSKVDIAILSHGHYDHAGGLRAFMEHNHSARLYIHRLAASRGHFATELVGWRNIGIDEYLCRDFKERIILTDERCVIDDELLLFSDILTADFIPGSNSSLFERQGDEYVPDRFLHEQSLLIRFGDNYQLIAGCAHRGIINIIRRASDITGKAPANVFSGFHLTNPGLKKDQPEEFVRIVGNELANYPCRYYTGHCTGMNPYNILKEILGEKMNYLSGGLDVKI